ncbi:MAG TPA: hypothetical protein PK760_12430, partial [Flavobacteriales bacterium]|nr:hypothetical protein [Flavobacteriales bacterium]
MSSDVSTVGQGDISLKFWWLCEGGNQNYGQVYYSTDGGNNWTQVTTPISSYRSQSNWVEQTVTLAAFNQQALLRFGFRFHNGTSFSAADPGFAIDDVRVIAESAVPNSITTAGLGSTSYCAGISLSVPYTIAGTYTAGNVFTAQLSDASGSFASPTDIGSISRTSAGVITCMIPGGGPVGSGYRIRVVASTPATIGSDDGTNISISVGSFAGNDNTVTICPNQAPTNLFAYLPGADACGTWTAPNAQPFSGFFNPNTDPAGVYTYTTNCGGGCAPDAANLTVLIGSGANAGNDVTTTICSTGSSVNLIGYVDGGDITGVFSYNGLPTNGSQLATPGVYPIQYVVYGVAPCGNDTATMLFTVIAPANAGNGVSVTICANDPTVDLFTFITGSPQTGGVWTDPGGDPFGGTFNPAVDLGGLYTYTVNGTAPCPNDQSFVAVVLDPCAGIEEHGVASNSVRWLGQIGSMH